MEQQNHPYQPVPSNSGYNAYASGDKRYGGGMRSAPNVGAVRNKTGYNRRDIQAQAHNDALQKELEAYPLSNRFI